MMCYNRFTCCEPAVLSLHVEASPFVFRNDFMRRAAYNPATGEWYTLNTVSNGTADATESPATTMADSDRVHYLEYVRSGSLVTDLKWNRWDPDLTTETQVADTLPTLGSGNYVGIGVDGRYFALNETHGFALVGFEDGFVSNVRIMRAPVRGPGDPVQSWTHVNVGLAVGSHLQVTSSKAYVDGTGAGGNARILRSNSFTGSAGTSMTMSSTESPMHTYHAATDRMWFRDYNSSTSTWSIRYHDTPDSATWTVAASTEWKSWVAGTAIGGSSPFSGIYQWDAGDMQYCEVTQEVWWLVRLNDSAVDRLPSSWWWCKAPFSDPSSVEIVYTSDGPYGWDAGNNLRW